MQILNKKLYILSSLVLVASLGLFFSPFKASAAGISSVQVKTAQSPTVYFLSRKYHVRKAYINATAYLSYGNKWSDIETVSSSYLNAWPEAELFRAQGTPQIYYIKGHERALISSLSDLVKFNLVGVPVLDVSLSDLAQYIPVSYDQIGLISSSEAGGSSSNQSNSSSGQSSSDVVNGPHISLISDAINTANGNTLVPGTKLNVLGVFHFDSPQLATVTSLTFNLTGVYNSAVVSDIKAEDGAGNDLGANINWRSTDHTITVQFRPALTLPANTEETVKILADLNACSNQSCNNQTLHLEISKASSISATLPVSTNSWPLEGSQFTLVSPGNVLGQVTAQADSLSANNLIVTGGSRLIGKFTLSETSGNEDVIVKQIIFKNAGSANLNDWQNFSLSQNGQVIARSPQLDPDGRIVFDINYLRIPAGGIADLDVTAELLTDYNPQDTYNLQLQSLTAVGSTYDMALTPTINNLNESYPLN